MIEPLIFGDKRLFGIFYPSNDISSDKLVVVCPPLFDEYRRSYRALSEFADACAKDGNYALRFDYSGTGDSGERLENISTNHEWLEDIETAIEEGITLSGASRVCLVGVRWGATLACLCQHEAVEKVIAWDLITNGSEYTDWLKEIDSDLADEHRSLAKDTRQKPTDGNYKMFALASTMLESMNTVRVDETKVPAVIFNSRSIQRQVIPGADNIALDYDYDWPAYEDGLIRPMHVLRQMLEHLRD